MTDDNTKATSDGQKALATAIVKGLQALGVGDPKGKAGAIDILGDRVESAGVAIAAGLNNVAEAIREHAAAVRGAKS